MIRTRHSFRGVTLIELIVVLLIVGIAIAAATPSFLKRIDRFALDSTGRQLVIAFRSARNEARLSQRPLLGSFSRGEFVILRGSQRLQSVKLSDSIAIAAAGQQYDFLASGQILGPERLEVIAGGRYKGALILGPPPGTVRFQAEP